MPEILEKSEIHGVSQMIVPALYLEAISGPWMQGDGSQTEPKSSLNRIIRRTFQFKMRFYFSSSKCPCSVCNF